MTPKIFESEYRFCEILWDNEPIRSGELTRLAGEKLGWKPTTAYTVIKRLAERGVLENRGSVVRALVGRDEVRRAEIRELVEKRFDGSLPAFIAAFAGGRQISESEAEELKKLIDGMSRNSEGGRENG